MKIFELPDLGEGLPDAEIVEWHVGVGDSVKEDDPLVSMETAKAVVEVPAPFAGKIQTLHGQAGDVIETGKPLVTFDVEGAGKDTGTVAGNIESTDEVWEDHSSAAAQQPARASGIKAAPAVRAFAKKTGVDLATVTPTGPGGAITLSDVEQAGSGAVSSTSTSSGQTYDEAIKGVRRTMAQAMTLSKAAVVPTSVFEAVDISHWTKGKAITERVVLAIIEAVKAEPALNASFCGDSLTRTLHNELHLGLAYDHEDGLFVPVIRNAEQYTSNAAVRTAVDEIRTKMVKRTLAPEELSGQTFILSNFGRFAGRYATPVVMPPNVAILAVGRTFDSPVIRDKQVAIGRTLPLSLTFDHRAVTGGEATRFIAAMTAVLSAEE